MSASCYRRDLLGDRWIVHTILTPRADTNKGSATPFLDTQFAAQPPPPA